MDSNERHTQWIMDEIRRDCASFKARVSGSESDRQCTDHLAAQLGAWADTVSKEPFTVRPHAFMGSIPLQGLLAACAIICLWLSQLLSLPAFAWTAAGMSAAALVSLICEYTLYLPMFDRLYPKRQAQNVFATRRAAETAHRHIILCGHSDAAFEVTPMLHEDATSVLVGTILADTGIVLSVICGILGGLGHLGGVLRTVLAIYSIGCLAADIWWLAGFIHWKIVSDGATDNMTGCLTAMSILKEMAESDVRLKHTDVSCLITSGEESGLRGAMAFARAHQDALRDPGTLVIVLDTLREAGHLTVYPRGINWTQANSPEVCALLHRAAEQCGVAVGNAGFYPGGTDAEAFSRRGIKAAALCGMSVEPSKYYPTHLDTYQALNAAAIQEARRVVQAAVQLFDQQA